MTLSIQYLYYLVGAVLALTAIARGQAPAPRAVPDSDHPPALRLGGLARPRRGRRPSLGGDGDDRQGTSALRGGRGRLEEEPARRGAGVVPGSLQPEQALADRRQPGRLRDPAGKIPRRRRARRLLPEERAARSARARRGSAEAGQGEDRDAASVRRSGRRRGAGRRCRRRVLRTGDAQRVDGGDGQAAHAGVEDAHRGVAVGSRHIAEGPPARRFCRASRSGEDNQYAASTPATAPLRWPCQDTPPHWCRIGIAPQRMPP